MARRIRSIIRIPDQVTTDDEKKIKLFSIEYRIRKSTDFKLNPNPTTLEEAVEIVCRASAVTGVEIAKRHDFIIPNDGTLAANEIGALADRIAEMTSLHLHLVIVGHEALDLVSKDWLDTIYVNSDGLSESLFNALRPKVVSQARLGGMLLDSGFCPSDFETIYESEENEARLTS
jgi:hypothetical protein